MESLRETFFEDPTYVYIALAVAEIVLAAVWHERRTRRWALALLVPPALAVIVFGVERLVVTDRERITAVTRQIAADVEKNDIDAVAQYLNDRITAPWVARTIGIPAAPARDVVMDAGKAMLRDHPVKSVTFVSLKVEVTGRRATMLAVTRIEFAAGEYKGMSGPVTWKLHWIKPKADWIIDEIDYGQGTGP
ncbi:MAG: hypothetical protein ACE15C_10685 [Phycisphaerae bacterium]